MEKQFMSLSEKKRIEKLMSVKNGGMCKCPINNKHPLTTKENCPLHGKSKE